MSVSNQELSNAIRILSMDAVEKAKSGHPGMPLGFADVATVLYKDFLKFSSNNPDWANRDRFILSAGHGSMLIYSLLYLTGYKDINLADIKNFRQMWAKTAGHPEVEMLEGIETTTGPLGQGIANAVGMALAERMQNARFPDLIDHNIYAVVGDGCLMEGISSEAISFAGHLKLSKLIVLFDDNDISIDGSTNLTTSENYAKRFDACGWDVFAVDGHNPVEIADALNKAKKSKKPSFIACKTTIAFGSPNKSGTSGSHGSPLGKEEIILTKKQLNCPEGEFEIAERVFQEWQKIGKKNDFLYQEWQKKLEKSEHKEEFLRLKNAELPKNNWENELEKFKENLVKEQKSEATRKSSGNVLEVLTKYIPELIGGSADLTGSVNTRAKDFESLTSKNFLGRYIHYGIREHSMAAIMNGMALYGSIIPYSGTFLVFSDYMRPAIRLSSLMQQRVIYVLTHDSIGLGEDGPTHQPVEHLDSLRLIPNLLVLRPCDAYETAECWQIALKNKKRPTILSLTRQNLEFATKKYRKENLSEKGAYIIAKEENKLFAIIIATGSEVEIAIKAQKELEKDGFGIRIVSMVSVELFEEQEKSYKKEILANNIVSIIAIEASTGQALLKYANEVVAMKSFGASAPAKDLYKYFEITSNKLIAIIKKL